jgi:hypothetical protein
MQAWMEYLYEQQAMPTNAKGVEVTIYAIDPNNNYIPIGTATSDTSGLYSFAWSTPKVPGKYTIIATFPGSKSYYASFAETAMVVSEAPTATPTPTQGPTTQPDNTGLYMLVSGVGIAIIIAIAIATLLILRKRP